MNKVLKIFGLLVIIIAAIYVVPGLVSGTTQVLTVMSDSMSPAINVGDMVVVKTVDPAILEVGDIVTYAPRTYGIVITHRIIEITESGDFVMQGDANRKKDISNVAPEQIIGECNTIIPYMGYIAHYVRKPIGFVILIVLPAIALILLEIKDATRAEKITMDISPESSDSSNERVGD